MKKALNHEAKKDIDQEPKKQKKKWFKKKKKAITSTTEAEIAPTTTTVVSAPVSPMPMREVDRVSDPKKIKAEAERRGDDACVSALTGDGLNDFCNAIQEKLKDSMVSVEALIPFDERELLCNIHQIGMVEKTEYLENRALVKAYVPLRLASQLTPMRQLCVSP